ncbi:hypothetical protein M569_10697 [Genlisea aurea]|uniref:Protein HGH1 homolog n=1 Tax=Genlisea aurea TaxID=192259 RepID=S8DVX9_9LAMI|nr:hypothetical protein M569_10697 [Genlisea aurea]
MATELEELLNFLTSASPPIKRTAVNIIRDYTGSDEGLRSLGRYSDVAIPALSALLAEKKEVSEPAAEALVNLSQNRDIAENMIEKGVLGTAMNIILYKQDCGITKLLVMLLVNLTHIDAGIESLLQSGDEKISGLHIMKLVRSFCSSSSGDPFDHVSSVLVNVSRNEAGRKLLLEPRRGLLKQIIRQFDSPSLLRKKGISGTIRNCCFEAETQVQNLLLVSEFLWPALLLPVAGNKIYNEQDTSKMPPELATALSIKRETTVTDPEIRVQVLDAIYLLVLQEEGRRAFWSVNGPRILQIGYEDEENPQVMEAYERVGSLLIQGGTHEEEEEEAP